MGNFMDDAKARLQEEEYVMPIHWNLGGVDKQRYRRLSELLAKLISRLPAVLEARRVLVVELGCGDGAGTIQLWRGLHQLDVEVKVHGFDYSERAIEWARRMTEESRGRGLSFEVADAEGPPIVDALGWPVVVLMREVVEHLTEEQFAATVRGLKTVHASGNLVLTTPTINSPTEPKHYRHYTEALVREWCDANGLELELVTGFGLRPRQAFVFLSWLKNRLNGIPFLCRIMDPFWREVPVRLAMTLVAVGRW